MRPKFLWTKLISKLLFAVFLLAGNNVFSQDITRELFRALKSFELRGYRADSLRNDTGNMSGSRTLITARAVKQYVDARMGIAGPQGIQGIQGIQGLPGLNGTKWSESSALPNNVIGAVGDFHLNKATGDFYEKTGVSSWTVRGNLRGPQGLQGLQGLPGADGTNGTNGATGAKGDKGDPGTSVRILGSLADSTLLPGSSTAGDGYLISGKLWVSDGTDFTNVGQVQGPQGIQGTAGTPGSKWFDQNGSPVAGNGNVGDFYVNRTTGEYYEKTGSSTWTLRGTMRGPQGLPGATGATGPQGLTGATGASGSPGATGAPGTPGSKWIAASGSPSAGAGIIGDYYLNNANGDVYEKTGASTWTSRGNIRGPQGADGVGGGASIKKIIWD